MIWFSCKKCATSDQQGMAEDNSAVSCCNVSHSRSVRDWRPIGNTARRLCKGTPQVECVAPAERRNGYRRQRSGDRSDGRNGFQCGLRFMLFFGQSSIVHASAFMGHKRGCNISRAHANHVQRSRKLMSDQKLIRDSDTQPAATSFPRTSGGVILLKLSDRAVAVRSADPDHLPFVST